MSKRRSAPELLKNAKKLCNEKLLLQQFLASGRPVRKIEELPTSVLHRLVSCIFGKAVTGESRNALQTYRATISSWIKGLRESSLSAVVAERLRFTFSPIEIDKLRLQHHIDKALAKQIETDSNSNKGRLATVRSVDVTSVIPFDDDEAMSVDNADIPLASIVEGEEEEYDFSDDDQNFIEEIDGAQDLDIDPSVVLYQESNCEQVRYTMLDVFRIWLGCPSTLPHTQQSFTGLFTLLHLHKPTMLPDNYKGLPRTGNGFLLLPKKYFENVKFRNLNEYRPKTDDFPEPKVSEKRIPIRRKLKPINKPPSQPNHLALVAQNEEQESESDSEEDDNISIVSERCNSSDDDDGNAADSEGEGAVERPRKLPNPLQHLDCEVEQVISSNLKDADGVDSQMQLEAENNKQIQEMAYFGIENVLTGRNPGLFDQKGFENVLKAMLVLNENILSEFFVDKCFPNSSDRGMVSNRLEFFTINILCTFLYSMISRFRRAIVGNSQYSS
jgi:hypothetical protein